MTHSAISYSSPSVTILQSTPLLVAELAGRTAYDSFANSEHAIIRNFDPSQPFDLAADSSELLTSLAWVHHHHSVLEHISISYLITGTPRGVLQEFARHRIASYTVRSTRYTMSDVINAFIVAYIHRSVSTFIDLVSSLDLLVTTDPIYNRIELEAVYNKLRYQLDLLGYEQFLDIALSKITRTVLNSNINLSPTDLFVTLQAAKKKRNVGDAFKHIVTDNWKVDLVATFNLRSLRNFFELRDSGAAYFLIQDLARHMKAVTPSSYLDLIVKPNANRI